MFSRTYWICYFPFRQAGGIHSDKRSLFGRLLAPLDTLYLRVLLSSRRQLLKSCLQAWACLSSRRLAATFARRKTEIPTKRPDGLASVFASDPTKQQQWSVFVEEVAVNPGALTDVVEALAAFLLPHAEKASDLKAKR
jgi:hypothetical protein